MHRLLTTLVAAMFSTACFQSTALLTINGDGSGTIEHQTLMTTAGLAQMRQLSSTFGGSPGDRSEPFSEREARDLAGKMGEGVTLVSTTPLKTASGEGRNSVYGFRDITKLRFDELVQMPGDASVRAGGAAVGGGQGQAVTFDLARPGNGNVVLTLHAPDPTFERSGLNAGNPTNSAVPLDQLLLLRQALAGLRVGLRVQPAGTLVRTSSPYVDGQTVTLVDFDLDQLLKDETIISRLQNAKSRAETEALLKNTPGLKMHLGTVTIEFTPAR